MIKNKKAQEELIGFVAIVVLFAVVALVFLGFSLRKPSIAVESVEINQFLESTNEYTTDCALNFVPDYSKIGELFDSCYRHDDCIDGKSSCVVLNSTLSDLINVGLRPGPDRPLKGYQFSAKYSPLSASNSSQGESIVSLQYGNCTSGMNVGTSSIHPSGSGIIKTSLIVCS